MVEFEKMRNGVLEYVKNEMGPHLTKNKRMAVGAYVDLMLRNPETLGKRLRSIPAIALLDVLDDKNRVDIDALREVALHWLEDSFDVPIPLLGEFRFNASDIEKIYTYVVR